MKEDTNTWLFLYLPFSEYGRSPRALLPATAAGAPHFCPI